MCPRGCVWSAPQAPSLSSRQISLACSLSSLCCYCCWVAKSCSTFVTSQTAACQASLSSTVSWSLLRFTSLELVMLSNYVILRRLPFPFAFNLSQHRGLFQWVSSSYIRASASASVLPMNIYDWFPLGWTGWISLLSKGLSRVFSRTTVWKHQFFCAQPSLCPTLIFVHDYWKNHSFDNMYLCRESDVAAF